MAASANAEVTHVASRILPDVTILSGQTLYRGSVGAIVTDGTTSDHGKARPFASAKSRAWGGWMQRKSPDSASSVTTATMHRDGERDVAKIAISSGLNGNRTDIGKVVWQSDDNTFSFTRSTYGYPYGVTVEPISSSYVWVQRMRAEDLAQFCLNRTTISLGTVSLVGTTGPKRTGFPVPFHCDVVDHFAYVRTKETDTTSSMTVALWIHNGTTATAITGGTYSVATADTKGSKKAGAAITALNRAHEGETLQVRGTASGTMAAGEVEVFVTLQGRYGS